VSFDLTSFDMASCVEDVILCMEFLANQTTGLESDEETSMFKNICYGYNMSGHVV